jgi:hypothetical protein
MIQTTQLGTAAPVNALPGRSLELSYDGQGNRLALDVDGLRSHDYTPNEVNEYSAVAYGVTTFFDIVFSAGFGS